VHPNVLPLRGVIDDEETGEFSLVMDLMEGGSLREMLKDRKATLTFNERISLSVECARAVQYLHTLPKPMIHRDIKSANFLIDRNGTVKIGQLSVGPKARCAGETH
jgi:serine/threonine protein kinase